MNTLQNLILIGALAAPVMTGCGKKAEAPKPAATAAGGVAERPTNDPAGATPTAAPATSSETDAPAGAVKTGKGVDATSRVIKIGALNDESGPAAAIGKPFAVGKRLLAKVADEMLPEGWSVALVERDHGYNPQKSVQAYNEIKDDVLYIATSFGTPNTLPLRPMLARDGLMAFPASLSSKMAEFRQTPPLGPSYTVEARRAMDWVVDSAGDAEKVKAAIIYQQDDYGKDGLAGWKAAAARHGVEIVSEQSVAPGQKDMAAVVTALKDKGATHVLLTTLPSATGPILGTAAQLKFMPVWIGNTPAWIDAFFIAKVIPPVVFTNYHQMSGLPFWGEDVQGMSDFLATWEKHGKELGKPDFYVLLSFIQGMIQFAAIRDAIEAGDVTRAGFAKALAGLKDWDGGGMIQPIDLSAFPYATGTRTRVLKPIMDKGTWTEVAPYAAPQS